MICNLINYLKYDDMKKNEIISNYFSGFRLSSESKNKLKKIFPPKYSSFIGDHITFEYPSNIVPYTPKVVQVVGYADDKSGLEALVVKIDGSIYRPDHKTYHITWSLDRKKGKKPVMSNYLITKFGWKPTELINIYVEPELFKR